MTCFGVDWHRRCNRIQSAFLFHLAMGARRPPDLGVCVCFGLWGSWVESTLSQASGSAWTLSDVWWHFRGKSSLIHFLVPRLGPSPSRERPCHFHSKSIRAPSTANHYRWWTHRTQTLEKVGWAEQHRTPGSSRQMYRRTRWWQFRGHSSFMVCPKLPKWNAESLPACQEMTNCTFCSLSVPVLMPRLSPVGDTLFCTVKIQTSLIWTG